MVEREQEDANTQRPGLAWLQVPSGKKDIKAEIHRVVKSTALFQDLPKRDWTTILGMLHLRTFKENEVVFESGTPGLGMYVILEGEVKIIERGTEEDIELARFSDGAFLGELSLIDDLNRSATAIAVKPTKLVGFFRPQLQQLMHQRPKLGVILLERLAKIVFHRLRIANMQLTEAREALMHQKGDA